MLYRYMYDITLHGLCPHSGEYCPCRSIRERNSRRRREPKASPFESELSIFSLRKGALRKWYNSLYQSKTSWNDILPDLSCRQKITLTPTKKNAPYHMQHSYSRCRVSGKQAWKNVPIFQREIPLSPSLVHLPERRR